MGTLWSSIWSPLRKGETEEGRRDLRRRYRGADGKERVPGVKE